MIVRYQLKIYNEMMPREDGDRKMVKHMHTELRCKNVTDEGRARKKRIIQRLFFDREKTLLHMHLYLEVLKPFKTYVETFQKNEPLVHRLCDEQEELLKDFLSHFIKLDVFNASRDLRIVKSRPKTSQSMLPHQKCVCTEKVLDRLEKTNPLKTEFIKKVSSIY